MTTTGSGSSNTHGGHTLYVHYDIQEISNGTRITRMRDKDNIPESEYRRGVSTSQ